MSIEIETLRAELSRMREDHHTELARARVDGFEAGLAQARNEREAALLSAVDAIQADLESIGGTLDTTRAELTRDAAELALAAAGHIAGRAITDQPVNAIDDAIGRALAQVARGTELTIRIHPDLETDIAERIARRQAGDVHAGVIEPVARHHRLDHGCDRGRFAFPPRGVLWLKPVEAEIGVVAARLLRNQQRKAVTVR